MNIIIRSEFMELLYNVYDLEVFKYYILYNIIKIIVI